MDTCAGGVQKSIRFADAETVRSAEEGINSYFRLLLGSTVLLFGAAAVRTRFVPRWLGWVGVAGGLLYMATGIVVAFRGFKSGFGDAAGALVQLLFLIFVVGVLVVGLRGRDLADAAGRR